MTQRGRSVNDPFYAERIVVFPWSQPIRQKHNQAFLGCLALSRLFGGRLEVRIVAFCRTAHNAEFEDCDPYH